MSPNISMYQATLNEGTLVKILQVFCSCVDFRLCCMERVDTAQLGIALGSGGAEVAATAPDKSQLKNNVHIF